MKNFYNFLFGFLCTFWVVSGPNFSEMSDTNLLLKYLGMSLFGGLILMWLVRLNNDIEDLKDENKELKNKLNNK